MRAEPLVTAVWTLAVSLSGLLSVLLIDTTLKKKYSAWITAAGWAATLVLAYAGAYFTYSLDITQDYGGIIGISVLVWGASILLYEKSASGKLFVAIMATLIANVTTFFFCGTTLSFITRALSANASSALLSGFDLSFITASTYPYNIPNIGIFIGIKIVWFIILYILYYTLFRKLIMLVLETLDGKMQKYLPSPIISFFGFFFINWITNHLKVFPGDPIFIFFYAIICLIFVFEYWQTFTTVFWSSRALKTEAELNIASNIQRDMLPGIFPPFPDRVEFDIYALMEPAKEVGGDFYDFFFVDDTHVAVVIADVSGKGVPAALFMVISKTLIKNQTQPGLALGDVFTHVNEQLCENNNESMFVTAFMGVLDLVTGQFEYVNAGHNPPLIKRANGDFEFLKIRPGFILAGMEGMSYRSDEIVLNEGDRVYLYTDGVTEATNAKKKLYGDNRLLQSLNTNKNLALKELLNSIKDDIDVFVGSADQFDDITMLILEYKQKSKSPKARIA